MSYRMKIAYWTQAFNFTSFQNLNFVFYFKDIKLKKPERMGEGRAIDFWSLESRSTKENDLTDSRKSKGRPRTILKRLRKWQLQAPPEVGSKRRGWNKEDYLKADWKTTGSPNPCPLCARVTSPPPPWQISIDLFPEKSFWTGRYPDRERQRYHYWK